MEVEYVPKYIVTASYYETIEVDADNEADAIDQARRSVKLPGGVCFDEYEAERIDEEDEDE